MRVRWFRLRPQARTGGLMKFLWQAFSRSLLLLTLAVPALGDKDKPKPAPAAPVKTATAAAHPPGTAASGSANKAKTGGAINKPGVPPFGSRAGNAGSATKKAP